MLIALRQLVERVVGLTEGLARITNRHCYAGASIIGQLASHRWHHFRQGPGIAHITSTSGRSTFEHRRSWYREVLNRYKQRWSGIHTPP